MSKASDLSVDLIEDLEEFETPEEILLKAVYHLDVEDSKEKSDKENILSALRFRWEVFRICLDLTKNNSKLEMVAQEFAQQAFDFCRRYSRKSEFKRLCEILRGYLHSLIYPSKQSQSPVNIHSSDSMQLLINVRFDQLSTALSLELWQEAFRSIEDLHGLFVLSKDKVNPSFMIIYYESLIKIFQMSGDTLFHAAAWRKLLSFVFSLPDEPSTEKLTIYCSSAVLAALSITSEFKQTEEQSDFDHDEIEEDFPKSREAKYTSLLGLNSVPDKEELIKSACSYSKYLSSDVRNFAEIVQKHQFDEEDIQRFITLAVTIEANPSYKNFLYAIRRVMAHRYLHQISTERREISFTDLLKLTKGFFDVESFFELESFLYTQNQSPSCKVVAHIDQIRQVVSFSSPVAFKYIGPVVAESRDIACLMQEIQALLKSVIQAEIPEGLLDVSSKLRYFNEVIEAERLLLSLKQKDYYNQKEQHELFRLQKDQEELDSRNARTKAERDADKLRFEDDSKRRELEKLFREKEQIERHDKIKLLDEVNKKLQPIKKHLDPEIFLSMTKSEILREQARLLDEAKKEIDQRFSAIGKRLDHKERALRFAELPLIKKQFEKQQELDKSVLDRSIEEKKKMCASKRLLILKKSCSALMISQSSSSFIDRLNNEQHSNLQEKKLTLSSQLEAEKSELKEKVLNERYRAALKAEQEAQLKKLDEVALKQREKDVETQRRLEEQKTNMNTMQKTAENVSSASASTKFVPRHKRSAV